MLPVAVLNVHFLVSACAEPSWACRSLMALHCECDMFV
jgi:hypothetical protein